MTNQKAELSRPLGLLLGYQTARRHIPEMKFFVFGTFQSDILCNVKQEVLGRTTRRLTLD
jgi:hypothetical protein